VHLGHLASARSTRRAFDLDRVLLVLSARPPHKRGLLPAPIADRMAMLELATAGEAGLEPSDLEVRRAGPSYTYDTLRELGAADPTAELHLIVGIDAYLEIDSWHRSRDLLVLANVVVTSRPGQSFPPGGPRPPVAASGSCCYDPTVGCYVHESGHVLIGHLIDGVDVSASEIRSRAREGLPIDHLTGPAVARYIRDRGLYGARSR
jgi:nicotinate-nucleotide adenylyltransferase